MQCLEVPWEIKKRFGWRLAQLGLRGSNSR